jgi:hypothetical protein
MLTTPPLFSITMDYGIPWQDILRDKADMATFTPSHQEEMGTGMGLQVLMSITEAGRFDGNFRLCVFGGSSVEVSLPAYEFIPNLPPALHRQYLRICVPTDKVNPPMNRTATEWVDLEDMMREHEIVVTDHLNRPIDNSDLLPYLTGPATEREPRGASIRWAVTAETELQIQLELHTMPNKAQFLNNHAFLGDNAAVVRVGQYDLTADVFVDNVVSGPVPLLFTTNQQSAYDNIVEDPDGIMEDISKVNHLLIKTETILQTLALEILKLGIKQAGHGESPYPLFKPKPGAKRLKISQPTPAPSGRKFHNPNTLCQARYHIHSRYLPITVPH